MRKENIIVNKQNENKNKNKDGQPVEWPQEQTRGYNRNNHGEHHRELITTS